MLSESTVALLAGFTYRTDAKRGINYLPLSGIYWNDELPNSHLWRELPKDDYRELIRLFALRRKICRSQSLSDAEKQFWDIARSTVPDWALFSRTTFSEADRKVDAMVYRCVTDAMDEFLAGQEKVSIREKDGVQTHSVSWKVSAMQPDTETRKSWWKRLFHK